MTTTKTKEYGKPDIGVRVDGHNRTPDEMNHDIIDEAIYLGYQVDDSTRKLMARYEHDVLSSEQDDSQRLSEEADAAVAWLGEQEDRPYLYWEITEGMFGLFPNVREAVEDVAFRSVESLDDAQHLGIETAPDDSEYPPFKYRGVWLHVNERGNCILYDRYAWGKDRELWSCV